MSNLEISAKPSLFPGLALAVAIALFSQFIHNIIIIGGQKPVSGVIIAILLGILIKNTMGIGQAYDPGINFALKKVLKGAIILLGLSLSFTAVIATGSKAFIIILISVTAAITMTYIIGKLLGLDDKLSVLIGMGTAICGTTAIVATSPAIKARDEEVTFSVATITIFGIVAIFLYPILGSALALSDMQFGTWAGVAIHETAQVVAAGFAYNDNAGQIATVVKLTRTVLLAPLVLILGIIFARRKVEEKELDEKINYLSIFPWFVFGFLAMAGFRTIGDTFWETSYLWTSLLGYASDISKFLIVTAMASIGLLTNFSDMKRVGMKPFIAGLAASVIMAGFSILLIFALGI